MIEVEISADEMYPVFSVAVADKWSYRKCLIPKKLLAKYNRVNKAFGTVQDELEPYFIDADKEYRSTQKEAMLPPGMKDDDYSRG